MGFESPLLHKVVLDEDNWAAARDVLAPRYLRGDSTTTAMPP
jgi:hypothetical protein